MKTFKVGHKNGKVKRGKSPRNLRREKCYSVWVGGGEANDFYLTKEQAQELADKYKSDGYTPIIRKIK